MKTRIIGGTLLLWALTYHAHAELDAITPWRVQLRVHTCDAAEAGTDGDVFVQLTNNPGDRFWLARGGDDRRPGQIDTYDVWIQDPLPGVTVTMRNITELTLGIADGDKWCFDRVELFINHPYPGDISPINAAGYRIFDSGTLVGGRWVSTRDAGDPRVAGSQVTIASEAARTLRGRLWNLSGLRVFAGHCPRIGELVGIHRAVLEDMLESFLGHLMGPGEELSEFRFGARVGRSHVTVRRKTDNSIIVDADIVRGRFGASRMWDKEIVLQFACASGRLEITPVSVDVSSRRWMNWLTLGLTRGLAELAEAFASSRLGVPPVVIGVPLCVPPRFTADADLTFEGTESITACVVP
jgi:hypothetical protein